MNHAQIRDKLVQRMDKRAAPKTPAERVDPYEALRAEIARRHPEFSDRLKVIAEFALEHPTEMALGTVAEVASRAKVQPSAVVRFANALGYGGFSEIQQVFRSRLVASVAPTYKERIAGLRRDGRFRDTTTPHSVLARFASEGIVSLESLQQGIREKDLARAISLIGAAETIFVLGLGGSFPVALRISPMCCASSAAASLCSMDWAARSRSRPWRPRPGTR